MAPCDNEKYLIFKAAVNLHERVNKTAAIYDVKKLTWMNGHYMRELDIDYITEQVIPFMVAKGIIDDDYAKANFDYIKRIVDISRDRSKTLDELADSIAFFFKDFDEFEQKGVKKHFKKQNAVELLIDGAEALNNLEVFTHESTEQAFRDLTESRGLKAAELIHPTRLAITGRTIGPGLFDIIVLLGKQKTVQRMKKAANWIEKQKDI